MLVTYEKIKRFCPGANDYWARGIANFFNIFAEQYQLTNEKRIQHFFAQAAHETGGFIRFVENMNYSARRLQVVFPRLFPLPEIAKRYGGSPERIAARCYANKGGNGSEASGDGWTYRGRGIFMLTLKNNYELFSLHVYETKHALRPDDVATPILAVLSAMWYWQTHGLNELADQNAIESITKKINSAMLGLEDRVRYLQRAQTIFV